jgi:hypothetical protein
MTTMNVVHVELTPEQCAELDAAAGSPDLTETILKRIADEVMARKEIAEEPVYKELNKLAEQIRYRLFSDVLLNVHHLMHAGRYDEAKMILCPTAAMIEGERPPNNVMHAMLRKIDEINLERDKADCEGNA